MTGTLLPLVHSHEADELETELKALFIKLYVDGLKPTGDEINVYGAPHLGSFSLVERNIDQDGLTVLRETTEDRIRYLFKAWRHRNPERGLHFLRLYLKALFGGYVQVNQLWHQKAATYPLGVKTQLEMTSAGDDPADFFLTSRVRVDIDTEIVPAKLLASLRSAVAARILLNVRIGKFSQMRVGVGIAAYGVNVCRMSASVGPRLVLTGVLPDWQSGIAYSSSLSIVGAVHDCTVTVLDGSQLPAGATVVVDNVTREVLISWPPYSPAVVSDIPLNLAVTDGRRTATWTGVIPYASTFLTSIPYRYLATEGIGVGLGLGAMDYRVILHKATPIEPAAVGFSLSGWTLVAAPVPEAAESAGISYALEGWTLRESTRTGESSEPAGIAHSIQGFTIKQHPTASAIEPAGITFSIQGFTIS